MKNLHDQIADKCVNFKSPAHNKECLAGQNYRIISGEPRKGYLARLPCVRNCALTRQPVGKCKFLRFPNEDEIQGELEEIQKITDELFK